jgi:hypothetical protein
MFWLLYKQYSASSEVMFQIYSIRHRTLTRLFHIQNFRSVEMNATVIVSCDVVVVCFNTVSQNLPTSTDRNHT